MFLYICRASISRLAKSSFAKPRLTDSHNAESLFFICLAILGYKRIRPMAEHSAKDVSRQAIVIQILYEINVSTYFHLPCSNKVFQILVFSFFHFGRMFDEGEVQLLCGWSIFYQTTWWWFITFLVCIFVGNIISCFEGIF